MGRAGQDQFMMATISDPKEVASNVSYHGTHPSKDGAMKMEKVENSQSPSNSKRKKIPE